MKVFGLGAAIGLKKITSDQAAQWDFGKKCVPFGLPKINVVDADGLFSGIFRKTFQETLLIPLHAVSRGKHNAIRNEGFHRYLKRLQKINPAYKGGLHQFF